MQQRPGRHDIHVQGGVYVLVDERHRPRGLRDRKRVFQQPVRVRVVIGHRGRGRLEEFAPLSLEDEAKKIAYDLSAFADDPLQPLDEDRKGDIGVRDVLRGWELVLIEQGDRVEIILKLSPDRKSTRLNSVTSQSRMPSSA